MLNLNQIQMFSQLPEPDLLELAGVLRLQPLADGEILFNMGDPGDELMIIQDGAVAIYVPLPGNPGSGQSIRVFRPGEVLGEMALIDRKPRSASARAEGATQILTLAGDDFRRLLNHNPEMALAVMAGLNDRIRYTTEFLGQVRQWVGKIAEGNYSAQEVIDEKKFQDQTLSTLAEEFARMAGRVQEREEKLRQEVAHLRIEIDETKRKQEAQRILSSDYYKDLKERARLLKQQRDE